MYKYHLRLRTGRGSRTRRFVPAFSSFLFALAAESLQPANARSRPRIRAHLQLQQRRPRERRRLFGGVRVRRSSARRRRPASSTEVQVPQVLSVLHTSKYLRYQRTCACLPPCSPSTCLTRYYRAHVMTLFAAVGAYQVMLVHTYIMCAECPPPGKRKKKKVGSTEHYLRSTEQAPPGKNQTAGKGRRKTLPASRAPRRAPQEQTALTCSCRAAGNNGCAPYSVLLLHSPCSVLVHMYGVCTHTRRRSLNTVPHRTPYDAWPAWTAMYVSVLRTCTRYPDKQSTLLFSLFMLGQECRPTQHDGEAARLVKAKKK